MKFHVPIPIATEIWTTRVPKKVQRPMGDTCAYEGQLTYEIRNTRLRMPRFQMRPPSPRGILICLFLWKKKKKYIYIYIYVYARVYIQGKGSTNGVATCAKKRCRVSYSISRSWHIFANVGTSEAFAAHFTTVLAYPTVYTAWATYTRAYIWQGASKNEWITTTMKFKSYSIPLLEKDCVRIHAGIYTLDKSISMLLFNEKLTYIISYACTKYVYASMKYSFF